ncbi:mitochondrial carrier domain-containing protein [Microdochium trichocladiopsis]|uniref:Mitochondrial glycine transporter n=1 Tax=Microdochium trichocladiopsis TaxID=1682393 RepID=A0A9P8Y5T3_9PEZI|nr:mitochondrial carrier domain-containing protein [Microdochium trichocladiopsis]KAH7030804.1 mitochondrial carrier domain-containing protein [Microdochium trichocladiopsis]
MADLLYDLLVPDAATPSAVGHTTASRPAPSAAALQYLSTLASMPLAQIDTVEQQYLSQSSHSLLLSLQSLSKRSHKAVIASAQKHAQLRAALPVLESSTSDLSAAIPKLDAEAVRFSSTYHKSGDNEILNARKKALLLASNVERLVDVLDLPTLLATAISSGSATPAANYSSALDLNGHIRRLQALYPDSPLVSSVSGQAEDAMQAMAKNLIASLRAPGLKLAAALRAISWLRRVVPELDKTSAGGHGGGLGALFLACRLSTLLTMLGALEPLRELADQEKLRQQQQTSAGAAWSGGQQTERYLKRYIEIFREQSFAIVSMFRSIFPAPSQGPEETSDAEELQALPSAIATFPLHLIEMLMETLRVYLPTVKDQPSRDSLLTQVLYCAGSLGRLGGDFSLLLASIDVGETAEDEWVEVVKRHRVMAGRLESIVVHRYKAPGNNAAAGSCRDCWRSTTQQDTGPRCYAFHFAAGLGSGIFGAVLLQPIDLLKTRVQQSGSSSITSSFREIAASPNALRAFWRGTAPSALRTGIGSAIYFTTLNTIRQQAALLSAGSAGTIPLGDGHSKPSTKQQQQYSSALPKLSNTANMAAGASARAFAGFILMPLTVIKVRYESNLYSYRSILGAARDIYRTERIPGFFAGFGATALRDAPYAGLYVLTYEQFKKRLSRLYPTTIDPAATKAAASIQTASDRGSGKDMASSRSATINFTSGALAGATCSFISNPFDAVKTRIQLRPREYRNMWQACSRMVREDGFRSLYDGLALRMTRKAVSSALAWMLYEELVSRAERTWSRGGGSGIAKGEVKL